MDCVWFPILSAAAAGSDACVLPLNGSVRDALTVTPRISPEQRDAIRQQSGRPIEVEDEQTHTVYVLMTREQFQKIAYDDSDLTGDEMLAAAAQALDDPEGWGAAGMEAYDESDSEQPAP